MEDRSSPEAFSVPNVVGNGVGLLLLPMSYRRSGCSCLSFASPDADSGEWEN